MNVPALRIGAHHAISAACIALLVGAFPVIALGVTCNRFDVRAKLHGKELSVSLETDLPDSTEIMIDVSRSYWANSTEYPLSYFQSKSTVGEWRKAKTVSVDDGVWQVEMEKRTRTLAAIGDGATISSIGDKIEVSFLVPIVQSDPRFGKGNSNLSGKRVETTPFRVVTSKALVKYPLGQAAASIPAEMGSPYDLRVNATYELSKETPLSPARHPVDPIAATAQIRPLAAGTKITVLQVDMSDDSNPWYRVDTSARKGTKVTGWINGLALVGQTLKVIERR